MRYLSLSFLAFLIVCIDCLHQQSPDFRQHLHVIAGLTETGQLEELKSYLRQYESELSEHRPSPVSYTHLMKKAFVTARRP